MSSLLRTVFYSFALTAACAVQAGTEPLHYRQQTLTLAGATVTATIPAGYHLELLTDKLDAPRLMAFAPNGDLFIGSHSDTIYRLQPPYNRPESWLRTSGYPHSIAFRDKQILIAKTDGLYAAAYPAGTTPSGIARLHLIAALPDGGGHNSRTVAVGPDGRIYLSLGISGNCSDQYLGPGYPFDSQRGGILVLKEGQGAPRWLPYGSGLRNPIGFDWHPVSGELYASNNGPDHHGFDQPPEYFSRILPGSFHGMPWFQYDGKRLRRDDCIDRPPPRPVDAVTPPVVTFPARNAPMGVAFVPRGALDKNLEHDAIVALHGSWGTQPDGGPFGAKSTRRPPKLVVVRFKAGKAQRVDELVTGFQSDDGERWARPVGVAIGPDGALYFTSDGGINGLFRLRVHDQVH